MATNLRPMPSLYTVYILRSTVRHASLYIGSTPNPPRRLKQHNGEVKGGATRTSRSSLRPWEMVGLVSGFPSQVGALKFEWALTNPHLSLHIPSDSRISTSAGRKRSGMPKRPRPSISSILQNLHLLLRVPSFARWPLKMHFFNESVYLSWSRLIASLPPSPKKSSGAIPPMRASLEVLTDFEPDARTGKGKGGSIQTHTDEDGKACSSGKETAATELRGIHVLPLDYGDVKEYVAKGRAVFGFEREGSCVVCNEALSNGDENGLLALCPHGNCEGVGHLSCWSQLFLQELSGADAAADEIVPLQGSCPSCEGMIKWGDMMKELTLRTRGQKEVERLLKPKRRSRKTPPQSPRDN